MIWRRFANYHASLKNDNIYHLTQRLLLTLCAINCERNKFVYLLYVAVMYLTYFVTSLASSTVGYFVNNLFYALCLLGWQRQIRSCACCGRARCHLPITKQLGKAKVSRPWKRTLTITLRYVYTCIGSRLQYLWTVGKVGMYLTSSPLFRNAWIGGGQKRTNQQACRFKVDQPNLSPHNSPLQALLSYEKHTAEKSVSWSLSVVFNPLKAYSLPPCYGTIAFFLFLKINVHWVLMGYTFLQV